MKWQIKLIRWSLQVSTDTRVLKRTTEMHTTSLKRHTICFSSYHRVSHLYFWLVSVNLINLEFLIYIFGWSLKSHKGHWIFMNMQQTRYKQEVIFHIREKGLASFTKNVNRHEFILNSRLFCLNAQTKSLKSFLSKKKPDKLSLLDNMVRKEREKFWRCSRRFWIFLG